ncbi:MAG: UDP-N-acetylmuramoyl-L-alanyl-D-glutamate--2,6-diaminopimelate ligase [Actinomycetota bacterium]|nr:UDP-N-acetylmuramoyl-L-alanyl-D-glutamate--2,6-diaminopimelate ligase [Actinomycetota bacterium]
MSDVRVTKTLAALAQGAGDLFVRIEGDPETVVRGVSYNSSAVRPGDLFFCVTGARSDGHLYAPEAAARGAVALCVEHHVGLPTAPPVAQLVVTDVRRAMGRVAGRFWGEPASNLALFGITGTNGKTTTAYLMDSILRAERRSTGLIGTIETRVRDRRRPGVRTTPESADLQALLAEMRTEGVDSVVMEVTSHALALHRAEGLRFVSAVFTNLTQDHLDFHRGMEDYFEAKRSLFVPERADIGAVNVDDPYGRRIAESSPLPCLTFGSSDDADIRPVDVRFTPQGNRFSLVASGKAPEQGEVEVRSPLLGAFNVWNALAAASGALGGGIGLDAIGEGLAALAGVPGRFEGIAEGQPFAVVVDYAHTPDSLDNVLRAARRLAQAGHSARVICVFGCGGDRDRAKRPLMGAVAARLADIVVVTSDNPRSESPQAIIGAILEGVNAVRAEGPDATIPDRAEAIRHALGEACSGDVVVVAGKGHETGQELAGHTVAFDDREVARAALRDLAPSGW